MDATADKKVFSIFIVAMTSRSASTLVLSVSWNTITNEFMEWLRE